jgi:CDP-diacylglycerol---glycerol-3-phosphate 3-phosphatidyltransferase
MLDNQKARSAVGKVVEPAASILIKLGLTPNLVTVIGTIGISISAIAFFSFGKFFIGTLVILLFIFSDLLDGTMARLTGKKNPIGAFLDSTLDRVTDAALFGSLVIYFANQNSNFIYPAIVAAFAAQLISYIRAKAESQGIAAEVGIAERPERIILLLIGTGLTGLGLDVAIEIAIVALALLTVVTVIQRMHAVYHTELR